MAVIACIIILLIVNVSLASLTSVNDPYKTIQIDNGAVRGNFFTTMYDAKPYYSYRGIPFAKPPLNDLRFRV